MILRRIALDPEKASEAWYFGIPAIAQLADEPLVLDAAVTVIVGENGSGKSTLLEASPPPGPRGWPERSSIGHRKRRRGHDLHWALRLDDEYPRRPAVLPAGRGHAPVVHRGRPGTPHQVFGGALNARSHGESFLAFLSSRDTERGLFILDEPEAALSFSSCLQLMVLMDSLVADGSQFLLATHSPLLAAFPGATILELDERGRSVTAWDDLSMVGHWRRFLTPRRVSAASVRLRLGLAPAAQRTREKGH